MSELKPDELVARVVSWYLKHGRDLPWRRRGTTAYAILVSEVMLQQTPVARVEGPWADWLKRWPTPTALAATTPADVIRAWGRLGYPRRALRLREAALMIVERHAGAVPATYDELRALPGIGDYTAAAVAVFAHRQRHAVLDTNVRRVLARVLSGIALPTACVTVAERRRATELLPADAELAATWSVGVMELGALICTTTSPNCLHCPLSDGCAWLTADRPAPSAPPRTQVYLGTDRQCRGVLLACLRENDVVTRHELLARWDEPTQATRALASLLADGLAIEGAAGVCLPN